VSQTESCILTSPCLRRQIIKFTKVKNQAVQKKTVVKNVSLIAGYSSSGQLPLLSTEGAAEWPFSYQLVVVV